MNKETLIERFKQTQSTLDHTKKVPFVLDQIRNKVVKLNTQISSFFRQEQPALCANTQVKIIQGVAMVNQMTERVIASCRNEHHFELYRQDYLNSIDIVERYIKWIYLSLENGYYEIEAAGATLHAAIKLAWQKKKRIAQAIKKPEQYYLAPAFTKDLQEQILAFVKQYEPFVQYLDQQDKIQQLSHLKWEQMSQANQYFCELRKLNQNIDSSYLNFLKQPSSSDFDFSQAFQHIKKLPAKLARFDPNHAKSLGAYQLLEKGRFNLIQANIDILLGTFEAYEFFNLRFQHIQKQSKKNNFLDIQTLIQFERKQLNYFSCVFKRWEENILKLGAFMVDLQILIGKILRSLESSESSWEFLQKTVLTVRKLVERSACLLQSWQEAASAIEPALIKSTLLPKTIVQISQDFSSELSQIQTMLKNYLRSFHRYTESSFETFASPSEAFQTLAKQKDIENITTQIHVILVHRQDVLQEILLLKAFYQQVPDHCSIEQLQECVAKNLEVRLAHLKKKWRYALRMEWFIDDLLTEELFEIYRFEHDYNRWIEPMIEKSRLKLLESLKDTKPKIDQKKENVVPPKTDQQQEIHQPEDGFPKLKLSQKQKKVLQSIYIPFQIEILQTLKRVCRHLSSERSLGILEVLEKPHTFFNYLDHLVEQYDPDAQFKENYYLENLNTAETATEFLLCFAEMKFLPYGFYTSDAEKILFCPETRQFKNNGQEMYLKISTRTVETPKIIFFRILKMLLGFENPEVLNIDDNQKLIDTIKMEYILTEDEQILLHQKVPHLELIN